MSKSPEEVGEILDSCLELLQSGQATAEALLARYADVAEELRPALEAAAWLRGHSQMFAPRPGFLPASRRRIIAQIQNEGSLHNRPLGGGWLPGKPAWLKKSFLIAGAAVLSSLVFLFGNFGVKQIVQAAVPGDRLFPLKIAQEQVDLALSLSATGDIHLQIEYTHRRLSEIQTLLTRGKPANLQMALIGFEQQVSQTVESLELLFRTDEKNAMSLANQFEQTLTAENPLMLELELIAMEGEIGEILRVKEIAAKGLAAVGTFSRGALPLTSNETSAFTPSSTLASPPSGLMAQTPLPRVTQATRPVPSITPIPAGSEGVGPAGVSSESPEESLETQQPANPWQPPRPTNTHRPTHKPTRETKKPKP